MAKVMQLWSDKNVLFNYHYPEEFRLPPQIQRTWQVFSYFEFYSSAINWTNKPSWANTRTESQLMTTTEPERQNVKEQAKCERPAVRPGTKYQNKQRLAQLYVSLKNTRIWATQQGEKTWHSSWDCCIASHNGHTLCARRNPLARNLYSFDMTLRYRFINLG